MTQMFYNSEVGKKQDNTIEMILSNNNITEVVIVDRATAARLINQLRRVLDND